MSRQAIFDTLLQATRAAYLASADMSAFTPFPNDIKRQAVKPFHCNCRDVFLGDAKPVSGAYAALQAAILAASDLVHWRSTYRNTDIGDEFIDQFGCYCIVGENAPFVSDAIRLFMVYMPQRLIYPWHHHPAEEIYMVVSGSAVFRRRNCPDQTLCEGETSFHASNQPHAMETMQDPVLCLVAWRNEFQTAPVLTT